MAIFFAVCVSVFNLFFRGFVVKFFWKWFILTKFPNLPVLETIEAVGLVSFVSALGVFNSHSFSEIDKDEDLSKEAKIIYKPLAITFVIAITFFIGWVVHSLM
tara:strand:+ start:530 stop:838 length:309 start_codon:yes stop_codon:yes gene_type:complete